MKPDAAVTNDEDRRPYFPGHAVDVEQLDRVFVTVVTLTVQAVRSSLRTAKSATVIVRSCTDLFDAVHKIAVLSLVDYPEIDSLATL